MSIRSSVISRLVGNRDLTSSEIAELDSLAAALDLNENDPYWSHVAWVWAVTPRKEWIDVAHRALAAEIRNDFAELSKQQPQAIAEDDGKLDSIKKTLDLLALRPSNPPTQIDYTAIKAAVLSGFAEQKKAAISSDAVINSIKDAAKETFSWILVGVAAGLIGLCLFLGTQFGEYLDSGKIQDLEKQVAELTAALAKK